MYNSKLDFDIKGVVVKQDEESIGAEAGATIMVLNVFIRTTKTAIFDDVNFGDKKDGLRLILSGALPITGTSVSLDFVRPDPLELRIGSMKGITVKILSMKTGPLDKTGQVIVQLKIKILKFSKEQAGVLVAMLGSVQEAMFIVTQVELELASTPHQN